MKNKYILLGIVKLLQDYKPPGKKSLQKIIYLIQRKGLNLDFSYSIHFFGPYSSSLEYTIQSMERQGVIEIEMSGLTSTIKVSEKLSESMSEKGNDSVLSNDVVKGVMAKFGGRSAKELELLTTTDYVANSNFKKRVEEIIDGVTMIKGDKFSREEIKAAIEELKGDYIKMEE